MNLSVSNLTKAYGPQLALDSVSMQIENIGCLALIGPSGGGKSTFLRIIGGLEPADSGTIRFGEELIPSNKKGLLEHRRKNGFLFQSFNLFPHMTAMRNITLPLEKVVRKTPEEAQSLALQSLERFGMADHREKFPAQLSGGQQQRVALARAVSHTPQLLLLDEPTSALDPEMTAEVLDLVQDLAESGQNIILSTHEMGFAKAVAHRIAFLADGSLRAFGTAAEVFENPTEPGVKRFFSKVMKFG